MGILKYDSNNSGGSFWLKTEDWLALEKAGWIVHWMHEPNDPDHVHVDDVTDSSFGPHYHGYSNTLVPSQWSGELWLGTPAHGAALETDDPNAAVTQFEALTGQSADDPGCNCCGPPHSFSFEDGGKTQYLSSWPTNYDRSWG